NYVSDTTAAFLAVGEAEGVDGQLFNIGSGTGRSVREMIDSVQRVVGTEKPVRQDKARVRPENSEVQTLICDYGHAAATFGYRPSVDFDEGLAHVRDYVLERGSPADVTRYRI